MRGAGLRENSQVVEQADGDQPLVEWDELVSREKFEAAQLLLAEAEACVQDNAEQPVFSNERWSQERIVDLLGRMRKHIEQHL